ncbi:MFS transporter [Candidatus Poriferisodalis sp.]|uniref:MFS transporter n=1 Tax=Candidatus Poriferisodalis sp. TaxID=3101277 RepID=UPI003B0276EE
MAQTTFSAMPVAAPPLGEPARLFSGPFLILNISALFSAISFSSMLPLTALLVTKQTGGGDVAVGFAIGVFAITAIAARPLIGRLGDERGRRLLIVIGGFTTAATFFGHIWADTYVVILIMRMLTGAFQGMFFVGSAAMISDLAPEDRRGEAISWFSVFLYFGMGLGPGLGTMIEEWGDSSFAFGGFDAAFALAGVLMALSAVIGWFLPRDSPSELVQPFAGGQANRSASGQEYGAASNTSRLEMRSSRAAHPLVFQLVGEGGNAVQPFTRLSEQLSAGTQAPTGTEPPPGSSNAGGVFYKPALWPGTILAMGIIIIPALYGYLPKLAEEHGLGWLGPVFFVYSMLVLVLRIIGRKLPDTLGTKRTATLALIGAAAGMVVMGTFVSVLGLYIAVVILALGGSLLYPALMVAAVEGVPPNERARALSTFTMFFELSAGIGGPILGLSAWLLGATVGAFYAAAACSLLGIVLLGIWQRGLAATP